MFCRKFAYAVAVTAIGISGADADDFGRQATREEIGLWNIDVLPDGKGLPLGRGSVGRGREVYEEQCAACHGDRGQGGIADRLFGGKGSLTSDKPIKTVGSFWPYATTLFDYVRRAMPYPAPQTLSDDDTYAVVAYILNLNGIVPPEATLDQTTLPTVQMPNRAGFVPDAEFRNIHNSRQSHPSDAAKSKPDKVAR